MGPPHMAVQKQGDQLEHTYSRSVRIRDIALRTCQCCIVTCRCMQNHNDDTIKTSDTVLRKIYLSLYLKRVVCERELETEQNCNILNPILMAISGCVFLVLQGCSTGGPGAQRSDGCWLSLLYLVSKLSDLQTD